MFVLTFLLTVFVVGVDWKTYLCCEMPTDRVRFGRLCVNLDFHVFYVHADSCFYCL